ncbi:cyclic pyranopterin monophosphate synthase MoaC [Alkalilimnicola ehrlichii]|uniref:Cyclic pyranopterin monophosphate synthase n=1 Tax=Alkalilimnicola ehrlichii TaxID=351052 RepID=A0A3E0WFC3_9GAMM|nr:cyclic pyranopterin monophosphate synthase MoaC [Alkalilimnicola ehrlichii]RFA28313.1 cyclic pyranopterin monophosphate synthase MoaC [Alkalilimnicola ehrlichii]RFA31644.1 cyclic pyranopterin monophosphate synthase MoaC [Alkalilimnicola ehrlichii]
MSNLTHLKEDGSAHIVDVGAKPATHRAAIAEGYIDMQPETLAKLQAGDLKKGDALSVARIAGLMAAKRTAELIPLCHPVPLTHVELELSPEPERPGVRVRALTETVERTGVEMEALTAVQVALLTIYDMCKALEKGMRITDVQLVRKSGGRSGDWHREGEADK